MLGFGSHFRSSWRTFSRSRAILNEQTFHAPTVYALSTPRGRSAVGVVRITGSACIEIFQRLTGSKTAPPPRRATLRKLYSPQSPQKLLDHALVIFFPGPRSYTGENLLELHLHGGVAVVKSVLNAVAELHCEQMPIRLAERGEFSRRGFQNGRFDLTEAEGINTLIHAETETQRMSALQSMEGGTKVQFGEWRTQIVNNVALLTTVIDFGEDHDIEEINQLFDRVEGNISHLETEMKEYLNKVNRSQVLLDGIKVTLIGPPNAGKSSLLNILAGDEKAIVSKIAGTTRDSIEVPLDVGGYKVVVGDTAGIRASENVIEAEGIKRAKKRSIDSDINILILSAQEAEIDEQFLSHAVSLLGDHTKESLVIVNKSDLVNEEERAQLVKRLSTLLNVTPLQFRFISCVSEEGIPELVGELTTRFKRITLSEQDDLVTISARAREILTKDVLYGFEEFHHFREVDDIVMASEALKSSIEGIGKITGEAIGVDEILGVVFSSFCIGK